MASFDLNTFFLPADVMEARLSEVGPVEAFAMDVRQRITQCTRKRQKVCMFVGEHDQEAVSEVTKALEVSGYDVTLEPTRKHMTIVAAAVAPVLIFVIDEADAPMPALEAVAEEEEEGEVTPPAAPAEETQAAAVDVE